MKQLFVTCYGDGDKIRNGGWVKTRANSDKGLIAASMRQVWAGSPAALCGYRLVRLEIDGKAIEVKI